MLKSLLKLIGSGDYRTPQELAEVLGTSAPLVEQMIAQLANSGYLTVAEMCSEGCEHCGLASACQARPGNLRLWMLTAKGMRACL